MSVPYIESIPEGHDQSSPAKTPVSIPLAVAATTAGMFVLLLTLDMLAPADYIPVQIKWLGMTITSCAFAAFLADWLNSRADARHQELVTVYRGECCARAYMDGVVRKPFRPDEYRA